jgi:membrane protein YqaA with SNARE-associated domain
LDFISLGLIGLFLASFLAATILPFSSELVLAFFLASKYSPWDCFSVALAGNFLGGVTNYWIGWMGNPLWLKKIGVSESLILKRQHWVEKYGSFLAFFSWVPIIGDPLMVVLGFFKSKGVKTHFWMFIGKALRYLVIVLGYLNWFV